MLERRSTFYTTTTLTWVYTITPTWELIGTLTWVYATSRTRDTWELMGTVTWVYTNRRTWELNRYGRRTTTTTDDRHLLNLSFYEISHLRFSILPAVEFCFLAISPILPYQNVLVRHTHPQLTSIQLSHILHCSNHPPRSSTITSFPPTR